MTPFPFCDYGAIVEAAESPDRRAAVWAVNVTAVARFVAVATRHEQHVVGEKREDQTIRLSAMR